MKTKNTVHGTVITLEPGEEYIETTQPELSGRLTDCSEDIGYTEAIGYGTVGDTEVMAIYLLSDDDMTCEDLGDCDWDAALERGRLLILES